MTDGASRTSTTTYDNRLRPATHQISGGVVNQIYDYYNDGSLRFVHNTSDNNFDRSYEYDHVGRITFATTGGSARGDLGAVPYLETVGYNAWSDTTSRFTETWAQDDFSDAGAFTNGRRDGWAYEATGNIKTIDTRNYGYDAAGNRNSMTGQLWGGSNYFPTSTTNAFDGDDKKIEETLSYPSTFTSRYLRSSVVGGQIAEEINSAGQTIIYVYLPDGNLLSTLVGVPKWKNVVPAGTGLYETYQSGFVNRVEFDPFKANVGLTAPPPRDTNGGDGDIGGNHNGGPTDSRFSDMSNPAAGCFDVEGVVLPCTWSIFDVMEVFVWGPARNPSANTRTDTAVWVPPKRVVPVNIPNPFTQFLTGENTDTATVSTTYIPGHWVGALAPVVRVNVQQSAPQKPNDDEFTPEQLERFKSCLSAMFKVYYDDHHYDRNGEAYFDGHSDSRTHFYNLWAIGAFRVRTDQTNYSSDDLKRKFGPLAGIRFGGGIVAGFTDKRSPYVNAIASDAGVVLKGRQFLGLWVYELGNALSVITNITPEAPADANDRYGIAGEPGAAFSDCVFGGALNSNGSVRPAGR